MKRLSFQGLLLFLLAAGCTPSNPPEPYLELSIDQLRDQIRGGWAAQTIGVTYGGPTEFQYNGTFMNDVDPINWDDDYLPRTFAASPGLYDDIYMDLTFVEVLQREGLDAPAQSFAEAFAGADYALWHANQMARYNVLSGMDAPASGHWRNNPHADDIDFQIEADFAGLMTPGMPNTAARFCDTVGHTMNYGDGWYGGVFVAALYSVAFTTTDVDEIVDRALSMIPAESLFHQTISDVIAWHEDYPMDWQRTWFEIQRKWSAEIGCPDGVFQAFNIDARLNAAYVVMGLLYGEGDFARTLEISTRAGQDSDCNPATAAGVLGTAHGYAWIPDKWKAGLAEIESLDFPYTSTSLNEVYELSLEHAFELIRRGGGEVTDSGVRIRLETPEMVPFEQSFEGHVPIGFDWGINQWASLAVRPEATYSFEGIGFTLAGEVVSHTGADEKIEVELYVDGVLHHTAKLTSEFRTRTETPFFLYEMDDGPHTLRFRVVDPSPGADFMIRRLVYYGADEDEV